MHELRDEERELLGGRVADMLGGTYGHMAIAELEIAAAQQRHLEVGRGPIWNAFMLLRPTSGRLEVALVYRAHVRELLDRVARGEDTRRATDPELMVTLMETSLLAPLSSPAVTLYMRLFQRRFPELFREQIASKRELESYESVHGRVADEHEAHLHARLAQSWRRLGPRPGAAR